MKSPLTILIFLLFVLGGAMFWLVKEEGSTVGDEGGLVLHCAAGFRKPMVEIARRYEEEFGVPVYLQFGGSGALASQLELAGGDLFLPADESYLEPMRARGELLASVELTRLTAGLVVVEGNPKNLRTLQDLGREGVRVSLGDESASIGKYSWEVLEKEGLKSWMGSNVVVTKPTVNHVVEDVATGAVDAAIAWDAVVRDFEGVEWISLAEFADGAKRADLGVLKASQKREAALHFSRYVVAEEGGRAVFEEMGFARPGGE